MTPRVILRGLILIATLVGVGFLFETQNLDKAWIDGSIRGQGSGGYALFVLAGALFTAVGLPRQVLSFLAGYAFGFATGTALAVLATALGCATTFFYARLLGRSVIAARFPGRIRKIDSFLRDNPFSMTLLIRLLPVGSNLLTNLAAGVSGVGPLPFILGSAIGYIPQNLVFALVGSGVSIDPAFRISLSVALFVASGAIGVYLYRRYRHGKSFDEEIEEQLGDAEAKTDQVR